MLKAGDRVVVGVSGGSDSIGLLTLLYELEELELTLIVCHINHGLREKESLRDENFVKEFADSRGLETEILRADTYGYRKEKNLSLEEAARDIRYSFFRSVLEKHSADRIATAHTIDDQAETVIMRLLRGSGSLGLSAIPPVSGNIIRPLLYISKKNIREYLRLNSIEWMEDSTNLTDKFLRNSIRNELLPVLKKYNPNIVRILSNLSDISRIESEYMETHTRELFDEIFSHTPYGIIGSVGKYGKQHPALRYLLIRNCIKSIKGNINNLSYVQTIRADRTVLSDSSSKKQTLPGDIIIEKGYDLFRIAERSAIPGEFTHDIKGPGKLVLSNGLEVDVVITDSGSADLEKEESTGYFSLRDIEFPIQITNLRPGDRFIPLGMKNFKKVKNLFIDLKVPAFLRKHLPVFRTGGQIFWIGGIRIDDRFKVGPNETQLLKINIAHPGIRILHHL